MNIQNAAAAIFHDQLGQILTRLFTQDQNPFQIRLNENDTLVGQLKLPGDGPPNLSFAFGLDIVTASVSTLLDALPAPDLDDLLDKVRTALRGKLALFDRQRDAVAKLIAAPNPASLREAAEGLFQGVLDGFATPGDRSTRECVQRLQQFLGNDISTVLPFVTIVNAQRGLQNIAAIPASVEQALLRYFFRPAGFQTVDGESIVAPVHLSDLGEAAAASRAAADVGPLRSLFSKTTAERYLRDTIRVVVESAFDAGRGLNGDDGRYMSVASKVRSLKSTKKDQDAIQRKFVGWFRGFSSMAESASMRAVEVGTQGVSQFQTNPLIAAAAGSFAGTAARKLAQDAFLAVLRTELDRL